MRRFLVGLIVGAVVSAPAVAHYPSESDKANRRHERVVERICARPHHWYHGHGVRVMPEACE